MAKKRFISDGGLQDTMEVAQNVILEAKNTPKDTANNTTKEKENLEQEEAVNNKRGRKPRKKEETNLVRNTMHNVTLDEKTLWRLEHIKKKLNKQRGEGDPFVSIDGLIYKSCVEWLDNNYPETNATYDMAREMGLIS